MTGKGFKKTYLACLRASFMTPSISSLSAENADGMGTATTTPLFKSKTFF